MTAVTAVTAATAVVAGFLTGYMLGMLSPAVLVAGRRGVDIHRAGSMNPGAANVGRLLGRRIGIGVAAIDILKGLLPAAGFALLTPAAGLAAGAGAVLGHVTSPLLRGRGGKGVATAAGAVLGSHPLWAPAAVLVWLAVLGLRRSVALASVASVVTLPVQAAVWWAGWPSAAWASGIAAVVIVRHQSNLRRWLAEKATARTACGDANGCPQEEL